MHALTHALKTNFHPPGRNHRANGTPRRVEDSITQTVAYIAGGETPDWV